MSSPRLGVSISGIRFGERLMTSSNAYRSNAENCLRMAQTACNDRDRPFWLNPAQSWLQLAEHSARAGADLNAQDAGHSAETH
jgi:hypothetical protein